jgi:hypothetical protein
VVGVGRVTPGTNKPREQGTMDNVTRWTVERVKDLGLVTSLETAGQILGIGRSKAYELARNDEFPVRVMRVGRCYRVPVPAILQHLGAA